MASILAIDAGPEFSAYADLKGKSVVDHAWIVNARVRSYLNTFVFPGDIVVLESPQAQNRPLGKLLRDTIWWAGRFAEAIESAGGKLVEAEERDVALELTGSRTGNNAAIYQALKDHFGDVQELPCGECDNGRVPGERANTTRNCCHCKGRGIVKHEGPLKGLNEHERSCVACALWYQRRTLTAGS